MKSDNLREVTFFFNSKKNMSNKRFYPLYEKYSNVRIVCLGGIRIKYLDLVSLKLFRLLIYISKQKIQSYETLHSFNPQEKFKLKKIVLHIDDPEYSVSERMKLLSWEKYYTEIGSELLLICTNNLTKTYCESFFQAVKVYVIEQGFHDSKLTQSSKFNTTFVCAYSSAYIHYGKDRHALHTTWGASVLIDEIIPNVSKENKNIEFLITGTVGKYALAALKKYPNVHLSGQVESEKNIELLSKCSIGIYTRKFDHNRSVLKIFTYIGAGLPIITFDLNDTEIVKSEEIGYSVKTTSEFVDKILMLRDSPQQMKVFRDRIMLIRQQYTWDNLAAKLERIVNTSTI